LYGQPSGTYQHYFSTFLRPDDVFWSFVEAIIIAAIVMITHCYYGYTRRVGALRCQPELQPHGVAAMTSPLNKPRNPAVQDGGAW
jgi:hypothetical protein